MELVKYCHMIKFEMPSVLLYRRKIKFMDSYKVTDKWFCKYISIFVSS